MKPLRPRQRPPLGRWPLLQPGPRHKASAKVVAIAAANAVIEAKAVAAAMVAAVTVDAKAHVMVAAVAAVDVAKAVVKAAAKHAAKRRVIATARGVNRARPKSKR